MAKEQKENVALTENRQNGQSAPTKKQEEHGTKYRIEELAAAAGAIFHVRPLVAKVALKAGGKEEYTKEEASKIVASFTKQEVK